MTNDRIRTHWDGCWRSADHHECAVARVERLEAERPVSNVEYRALCEDRSALRAQLDRAQAELAALRARCTRQGGDPTVDELHRVVYGGYADAPIARALLRAWGEQDITLGDAYDRAGEIHDAAEAERQNAREAEAQEWMPDPRGLKETLERLP